MEWKLASNTDHGISIPKRWLHLHYYEALNILFRAENALRLFTYIILKKELQNEWAEVEIQTPDGQVGTISSIAAKRISQAQGFGYLGYQISTPLMHLNSGELFRLVTSEGYWKHFKPYFKGKKEVIKNKFDEVGIVRNSLAHFRPVKYDDIELIKQNIKHAFVGIEECISEITGTISIVPTNTEDAWYKSIMTLGTELCTIQLYQSKRREWIRIAIEYNCQAARSISWKNYRTYSVLKLITPAIIKNYPSLAKLCVFISEAMPYSWMPDEGDPNIAKHISLIFPYSTISNNFEEIHGQLSSILLCIQNESELLKKDKLAQGTLIESSRISATLREGQENNSWWSFDFSEMKCPFSEDDPTEYWGSMELSQKDFIAATHKYPWMPSDISEEEPPF